MTLVADAYTMEDRPRNDLPPAWQIVALINRIVLARRQWVMLDK